MSAYEITDHQYDVVVVGAGGAGLRATLGMAAGGLKSSREHAPWALLDFGVRCVISTSFADIFYNNCFKNGILPIVVSADDRDALMADASDTENPELSVDLVNQTIHRPNGPTVSFEIDPFRKKCLLEGLDDIGLTLAKADDIDSYEAKREKDQPWL